MNNYYQIMQGIHGIHGRQQVGQSLEWNRVCYRSTFKLSTFKLYPPGVVTTTVGVVSGVVISVVFSVVFSVVAIEERKSENFRCFKAPSTNVWLPRWLRVGTLEGSCSHMESIERRSVHIGTSSSMKQHSWQRILLSSLAACSFDPCSSHWNRRRIRSYPFLARNTAPLSRRLQLARHLQQR